MGLMDHQESSMQRPHCDLIGASIGEGSLEGVISKTLFCIPEFLINVFGESILAIRPRLL